MHTKKTYRTPFFVYLGQMGRWPGSTNPVSAWRWPGTTM